MKEIISKITPTAQEQVHFTKITSDFCNTLNKKLKDAEAILGGSGAKSTWLAHQHDADVFVAFNYKKCKGKNLSDLLQPILNKLFSKVKRVHGSRDYFQIKHQDIMFEVVPILKITAAEQAENITDVSLLHAKWVNKHGKNIKSEIRLAKQFFKANRLYGAESYLQGFSGYIIEILTINYGSFTKLLEATKKWKNKVTLDPSKFYFGKDILFELNKSKTTSPLVIVDPVDRSRNAAAALGEEKYNQLKLMAKKYLKNPNKNFFIYQEYTEDYVKNKAKKNPYIYLEVKPLKGKDDVVGSKLLKAFNHLRKELGPFQVKEANWDLKTFYFILKTNSLPEYTERKGPPLEMEEAVKQFKKKNKTTFTKNKQLYAKIKNKYPELHKFIKHAIKHKYVQERVGSIS